MVWKNEDRSHPCVPMMLKRILFFMVIALVALVIAPFILFPFLAINEPIGAKVAVIEGWIPQEYVPELVATVRANGYDHIYTTGTVRAANYYLKNGDTLDFNFEEPVKGLLQTNIAGLDGAICLEVADEETLLTISVTGGNVEYHAHLTNPVRRLRIISTNSGIVEDNISNIFIKHILVAGTNIHELQSSTWITHADGTIEPGRPTHAETLVHYLVKGGLDPDMLTPLPTPTIAGGRTWSNAVRFSELAKQEGLLKVDVISMGVHARRSRNAYQKACGEGIKIGILSIPDPMAGRSNWWQHAYGWSKVWKEILGVPGMEVVGLAE